MTSHAIGASATLPAVTAAPSGFGVRASTTVGGSAPSSSGISSTTSSLASKRVQIMSSVGGSNHTFNTSAEKAVKTMEKVQELYTALSDKIRKAEKLSDDTDVSINLTRRTYSVVMNGVSVQKSLRDLEEDGTTGVDREATERLQTELNETIQKIVDLLSESKMVNFGGSSRVASAHQAYVGADLRAGPQKGIGSVVKGIQEGKVGVIEYLVPILQKLFAKEKKRETLEEFMFNFAEVKKYHEKFQEELPKVLDGGVNDPDLVALHKRLQEIDWTAVAMGIALRLTADKDGRIADEHMQIVQEAIDVLSPLPSTTTKIARFLSPEKREKAKAEHDSHIAHVRRMITGQSSKKSVEEALINYCFGADHDERIKTIALGMIFSDVTKQQHMWLKQCHETAACSARKAIVEIMERTAAEAEKGTAAEAEKRTAEEELKYIAEQMYKKVNELSGVLDFTKPETVKAFVKEMAVLLGLEGTVPTGAVASPVSPAVAAAGARPVAPLAAAGAAGRPAPGIPPATHLTTPAGHVPAAGAGRMGTLSGFGNNTGDLLAVAEEIEEDDASTLGAASGSGNASTQGTFASTAGSEDDFDSSQAEVDVMKQREGESDAQSRDISSIRTSSSTGAEDEEADDASEISSVTSKAEIDEQEDSSDEESDTGSV